MPLPHLGLDLTTLADFPNELVFILDELVLEEIVTGLLEPNKTVTALETAIISLWRSFSYTDGELNTLSSGAVDTGLSPLLSLIQGHSPSARDEHAHQGRDLHVLQQFCSRGRADFVETFGIFSRSDAPLLHSDLIPFFSRRASITEREGSLLGRTGNTAFTSGSLPNLTLVAGPVDFLLVGLALPTFSTSPSDHLMPSVIVNVAEVVSYSSTTPS
ncbi:hypothetical protein IW261DRAFT_1655244 [Armillaria novae-zelandiae]|uniref:Uncharacterized protein n=1 Tax=Armillaria novae-zelandiae TaxID=153914 RepID=A0AA39ULF7_9AGAR|nr:hypothetical protein IW261DRAFT_1655244 [Armillaria novae-zelandiae]